MKKQIFTLEKDGSAGAYYGGPADSRDPNAYRN